MKPQATTELCPAFADLGIKPEFLRALARADIETPSDIQHAMIPAVLGGGDVVGQARTGTGKTIAFVLPVLQMLEPVAKIQAVCLVPTRELAAQVVEEARMVAHYSELRVVAVYGGQKITVQLRRLEKPTQLIIATPGRLLDLMGRQSIAVQDIHHVVLDEVDRMLDIGFRDDIRRILRQLRGRRQTIVVSATIDEEIERLIHKHTHEPSWFNVSQDQLTVPEIDECYVTADSGEKFAALKKLLKIESPGLAIIFTNTKRMASRLGKRLNDAGYRAAEIHGDLRQRKRERVMDGFRKQHIHLLIATDLAARGIDIDDISHIINYDIPQDPEMYVHRIGRTGRMGKSGKAITLVSREEGKELTAVEMLINKLIPQRKLD